MRVLITGGAGFIGSHLAELCLERGDDVYLIDNLSTGSLDNIKHLEKHNHSRKRLWVTIDNVLNQEKMTELVGHCDVTFHLAAAVGVQYILDNPLSSIFTNIHGTETVLRLCNQFKKKILIASSSEVYGKQSYAPLKEADDCVYGPSSKSRWGYAATKLMDEFMGLAYYRSKQLPVIISRLFNTVGPRQTGSYGMVIPRFIKQAIENEPVTVYGNGTQTRTFTHVSDVVKVFLKLVETPRAFGEVINVGGSEEISILDLAHRIKKKVGSKSKIKVIAYEEVFPRDFEDMYRRVPSTEKLRKLVGFVPIKSLDEILDDVISYYQRS